MNHSMYPLNIMVCGKILPRRGGHATMESGAIWAIIFISVAALLAIPLIIIGRRRIIDGKSADWQEILADSGYLYDSRQNIFYSNMDAWQRNYGYGWLYDEAAAPLSLIFDCEPVYFEYGGKNWLIELWKGQYGMATGCEVGVYNTDSPEQYFPGAFNYTFYECASDIDCLPMSFALVKNGRPMFYRSEVHWWLTGFVLGEFSEPAELTMDVTITLKNEEMRRAFTNSLKKIGYTGREVSIHRNNVQILFAKPHSAQPYTRTEFISQITQAKNKYLCDRYAEATYGSTNMNEAIEALRQKAPDLYELIADIGRPARFFIDT